MSLRRLALVVPLLAAAAHAADPAAGPQVVADEPRAFGYQVGDLVRRAVTVHVPDGWRLDASTLPRPGLRGQAFELRRVDLRSFAEPGGQRHELRLEYQVFFAPTAVRTLEIAALRLRVESAARAEELRVEAWPVTVAPLVPVEVSPRRGLGDLQPDRAPPSVDTAGLRLRLQVAAGVAALLGVYLAAVYVGPPWLARRRRPFGLAWQQLRGLRADADETSWRTACQQLHEALNRSAGEVLFEHGLARFVAVQPHYAALRDELARFLQLSRREFFGDAQRGADDAGWLVDLCRRLRDLEQGQRMNFDDAWVLWLLPLAVLPLLAPAGPALANGWLAIAPHDRASDAIGWALRAAASVALAALIVSLAGPYRPEYSVERVGQGAEIVLVLDRSRSMDQGFAPGRPPAAAAGSAMTPEKLDYYFSQAPSRLRDSKGKVARALLAEFTAQRPDDRFALIVFSTLPMRVLDFTQKTEVIQAAIEAGNVGRGLSETNIGLALEAALDLFDGRPYAGSRLILLVSDGGDRIDPDTRERLERLTRKQRVGIYWLYLRSANTPGLTLAADDSAAAAESVAEIMLHRFFESLTTPYHAYEASDTQALQHAIADVNRLEKLPITYHDLVPRRELAPWGHALALAAVLLLLGARLVEIRRWA